MSTIERLRQIAADCPGSERMNAPKWEQTSRWQWEHYVMDDVREVWGGLSEEGRLVALAMAFSESVRDEPSDD